LIRLNFPPAKAKHSGTDKKTEASIIEILSILRSAQALTVLSQKEFMSKMLEYFTGELYQNTLDWINEGSDVADLYMKIVRKYYCGDSPTQAAAKLAALPANHDLKSLAAVETEIQRLAKLASYKYVPGDERDIHYEHLAKDTFLAMLPKEVKAPLDGRISQYKGMLNKELPFARVAQLASAYRQLLDKHFLERSEQRAKKGRGNQAGNNGSNGNHQAQTPGTQANNFSAGLPKPSKSQKARARRVAAAVTRQVNASSTTPVIPVTAKISNMNQPNHAAKGSNNARQGANQGPPKGTPSNNPSGQKNYCPPQGEVSCSLCPCKGHSTSECGFFLPEHRTSVREICTLCPFGKYHMEKWCPMVRATTQFAAMTALAKPNQKN